MVYGSMQVQYIEFYHVLTAENGIILSSYGQRVTPWGILLPSRVLVTPSNTDQKQKDPYPGTAHDCSILPDIDQLLPVGQNCPGVINTILRIW